MKQNLKSFFIAVVIVLFALNTPASWYSVRQWFSSPSFGGVGYTTLVSTDQLTDFPTLYNANNLLFDNGKIDVGTSSVKSITTLQNLVTVGALSSGSLTTGFTKVNVAQGGTGSTTLSQFQILLGSSTNAIGIVDGLGTSGQTLQSQGAGLPPKWTTASIDLAADYAWTGYHSIIGAGKGLFATNASSTNATSTNFSLTNLFNWGNFYYKPPQSITASSTFMAVGSNGQTSWKQVPHTNYSFATASVGGNCSSDATTTPMTFTLKANTMATSSVYSGELTVQNLAISSGGGRRIFLGVYYGTQADFISLGDNDGASITAGHLEFSLIADGATNAQKLVTRFYADSDIAAFSGNGILSTFQSKDLTVDSTSDQTFKVEVRNNVDSVGDCNESTSGYVLFNPYWQE